MKKKKIPKLIVMFDTNVLITKIVSELVRDDVKRILNENSNHPDLAIEWYLPEVVVGERKYQMMGNAKDLLPGMQKLERLLGQKFGIGDETLELHVDNAIKKTLKECNFQVASISPSDIDWNDIITRSTKRDAPFEPGKKEKGFRDSIIAHSFLQLHSKSPVTPSICRLALITNDVRLKEYVDELSKGSNNIRMLSNLEELENLINTLVSTVTEDFVAALAKKAAKLFFEEDNNKSIFYKEDLRSRINEKFSEVLNDRIKTGRLRSNGVWWISEPVFIKKDKRIIHWSTTVEIDFEIYHFRAEAELRNNLNAFSEMYGLRSSNKVPSSASNLLLGSKENNFGIPSPSARLGLTRSTTPEQLASDSPYKNWLSGGIDGLTRHTSLTGKEKFEVHWSANLTKAHNLTKPKIDDLVYEGNIFQEENS